MTKPSLPVKAKSGKGKESRPPLVGIIMGSKSDWEVMRAAVTVLSEFGIPCEAKVISAHRTPDLAVEYARTAEQRGLEIIIAGAGGAAHLPGVIAAFLTLPVIGVPMASKHLKGLDSLLSIAQMPAGIPVATMAIDNAKNAGLFAARILGVKFPEYRKAVAAHMERQNQEVRAQTLDIA
jgi:5-(carboxyamino)imidazole ribonucleotide mutase